MTYPRICAANITVLLTYFAFRRPGGYCEVAAPVPIPNTAVKRLSADGTLSEGTGE